ncbi:MAG: molybdopterin-dependent oxidoreductase [Streptosporangiaceae bacterium]
MTSIERTRIPAWRGVVAGLLAGCAAVGIGQLVAGFIAADSSPVVAVGEMSIDLTPPAVKNFAIRAFGSHDKFVLLCGIAVVLAVCAAVIGVLALRKLWYGMAGLGAFAVVGLLAAATRPDSGASYLVPTLAGTAAAAWALARMVRAAGPAPMASPGRAASASAPSPGEHPGSAPPAGARPGGTAPAGRAPGDRAPGDWTPGDWTPGGPVGGGTAGGGSAGGGPAGRVAGGPDRRKFLVTGTVTAGVALVGFAGGKLLADTKSVNAAREAIRLPRPAVTAPPLPAGADLKIPGLSPFITPNNSFYRVDTAIVVPEVAPASWQLRIHGMVAREITLTYQDLIRRPLIEDYITLCCVSNPVAGPYIGNALWLGASLQSLLREAGIRAGADQLFCTSVDGFTSGTPVQTAMDGRDAMLAVAMNGQALPTDHGFPVRLVVPGLYGYVSACKWITDIEVTTYASNVAYWAQRGWSQQAPIKTESRIDVPGASATLKPGKQAVAGVAWAQHKGIDAVEVRVDKGSWQQATLAAVPDIDTWRQWVWQWNATPGTHVIEARATDRTGYTQTALQEPPEPNGASGYPSVSVQVSS